MYAEFGICELFTLRASSSLSISNEVPNNSPQLYAFFFYDICNVQVWGRVIFVLIVIIHDLGRSMIYRLGIHVSKADTRVSIYFVKLIG